MGNVRLTKAAVALRRKLKARGAQAALTRALGCADGLVNRWLSGTRMPNAAQAAFIEKEYLVPAAWWGEPPSGARAAAA